MLFGLVCCEEPPRGGPRPCRIGGVCFLAVRVPEGKGLRERLCADRAAVLLRREGVRRAVFPADYPYRESFARRGVGAFSPEPLRRAAAPAIVRRCLSQLGVEPERATVAFCADRATPELRRLIAALAGEVRFVTLAVGADGDALARELLRSCGVAARLVPAGADADAALTVCLSPCAARGNVLPLWDGSAAVRYAGDQPEELLAALFAAGALDAEALAVEEAPLRRETHQRTEPEEKREDARS